MIYCITQGNRSMMKSTTIRMDDDLKKEASAKLEALGLNFNAFVVMAMVQLVEQNRVPFDLVVPADAIAAAESEKNRDAHARFGNDQAEG